MLRFLQQLLGASRAADPGGSGERLAADWLQRERGFAIVARNWRSPRDRRDELDLVCRDGDVLVFVEVKTRAAGALVPGYYAVDARKKRALRRAAEAYLAGVAEKPRTFRFDVVEVVTPIAKSGAPASAPAAASASEVLHFENVPLFSKHFRA